MENETVLSENLVASANGVVCDQPYRALLVRENGRLLVKVQQKIKDKWSPASSWYLESLLFGYPVKLDHQPSDGISIDYGQNWQIDSGMREALENAIKHI